MKKVTVIGGGTGTFVVLSGLKTYDLDLSVIVTMMDSGGSTGRLRDQLGVLPPGDLRQCLVALSEAPLLWRKLFLYRFENGDLAGHNFGNIFISALEKVSGDYNEVIDTISYVLKTKGKVLPVTFDKGHLCVEYESGLVIKEEGNIDEDNTEESRIVKAYIEPPVLPNTEALQRIADSDYVIIGPGDIYTSIVPVLVVDGIKSAIQNSKAKIVFIMNLVTKTGQTTRYDAQDFVADITRYLGRPPDMVVMNNGQIPAEVLEWYKSHHEQIVKNNLTPNDGNMHIIEEDLIDQSQHVKQSSDQLSRSILRHDSDKLAKVLVGNLV